MELQNDKEGVEEGGTWRYFIVFWSTHLKYFLHTFTFMEFSWRRP